MTELNDGGGYLWLRRRIVREARSWIGTPWHHCGRVKGVGVDCAGLVLASWQAARLTVTDPGRYSMCDETELFMNVALGCARAVEEPRPGDVLLFTRRSPSSPMYHHLGVWTGDGSFVHAWSTPSVNAVVETPLDDFWAGCVESVWRHNELREAA
ncbi:MAG: C40 family peptidase [Fimbriimonadaceae bacterium]|nr:C40 family peptidase [Fimbriimonadaceae bacterium]QYK56680.1 MAG: C40 family peptidase [Fimbriimonadaceae bacterium]